jgi:PAS domain-containing protein
MAPDPRSSLARPPILADADCLADPFRLDALDRIGLLAGASSPVLDRAARITAAALGVPVALVSLVDHRGQHFPGLAGLTGWAAARRGTPLSHSFCQHVVASRRPLLVEDAAAHPLVRDNRAHHELGVVAYAGAPLTTSEGDTLGALCAIDGVARAWTPSALETLQDLAALVTGELERRGTLHALEQSHASLVATEARLARALAVARLGTWEWDVARDRFDASPEWLALMGHDAGQVVTTLGEFLACVHPDDRVELRAALDDVLAGRRTGRDALDVRYRAARGARGPARLLHDVGDALCDADGRVLRLVGVVHDVAEAPAAA